MIFRKQEAPLLVSLQKIWDHKSHSAMTDLIRYQDRWYCSFRESDAHVYGKNGVIRVLSSNDTSLWELVATFEEEGVDLRDPKLSITPTGQLMLLIGGTVYSAEGKYITRQPRVTFSSNGRAWGPLQVILGPHEWLWRLTWHKGKGYGFSYRFSDPTDKYQEWKVALFETQDGLNYTRITPLDVKGYPNETTLRFLPTGEMIALLRRDRRHDNHAWIGVSVPPYTDWEWKPTAFYFGGPNFLILDSGDTWAAGRLMYMTPYGLMEKTALAQMTLEGLKPSLILPSGGDTSYPGLVYHEGFLWMSYYSTHEKNTAIYVAKILLP